MKDSTEIPNWLLIAVALSTIAIIGIYLQHSREKTRILIEQERLTSEQALKAKIVDSNDRLQRDTVQLVGVAIDQQYAERRAMRDERERRQQDYVRERDAVRNQIFDRNNAASASAEIRQLQADAESEKRRTEADTERQKQWLEQQERERQYAAERRSAASYADQYRQEAEERKRRLRR